MNLLDLLFPPLCAGCQKSGSFLCSRCYKHLCFLHPQSNLIDLLNLPAELQHVWSAVEYVDVATSLVTKVKYQHFYCYTEIMAEIISQTLRECILEQQFDAFVPIPLSQQRLTWRGFNQAEKLSQQITRLLHVPTVTNILTRSGKNQSQVSKNANKRHDFSDEFSINTQISLKRKRICLIDDVITTGTTLQKASLVLQSAGAQTQCLTFAASISGKI